MRKSESVSQEKSLVLES